MLFDHPQAVYVKHVVFIISCFIIICNCLPTIAHSSVNTLGVSKVSINWINKRLFRLILSLVLLVVLSQGTLLCDNIKQLVFTNCLCCLCISNLNK